MSEMIKCLSLWQPYATLVAIGEKRYETRSWPTKHRGTLLIHAAKSTRMHGICYEPHFCDVLGAQQFPLGAIIAICSVVACIPTDDPQLEISERERAFGDYAPGRWAWQLEGVYRYPTPIPFRGRQGLFNVPYDLVLPF